MNGRIWLLVTGALFSPMAIGQASTESDDAVETVEFSPVGEARFGLQMSNIGSDDEALTSAFITNRAMLGGVATLNERIKTRLVLNIIENRSATAVDVVDENGDVIGSGDVSRTAEGFTARARDAWVKVGLDADQQVHALVGIQAPIFGIQPWFNDHRNGFYTSSSRFHSVAILGKLYSPRVMGARVSARVGDRVTVAAMASNNENAYLAEDNTGKDLTFRTEIRPAKPVTVVVSGRYGWRGEQNVGSVALSSLAARYDSNYFRFMVDGILGYTETLAADPDTRSPLVGLQGATRVEYPSAVTALDSYIFTARLGYYDADLQVDDVTSWMQSNVSARVGWDTREKSAFQMGFGFESYIPANLDESVTHRLLLESLLSF